MKRGQAFAHDGVWCGYSEFPGGANTGWHHHGDYATYAHITDGEMLIEFGPGGSESVVARAGDAVYIPGNLVHRETVAPSGSAGFVVRTGGAGRDRAQRGGTGSQSLVATSPEWRRCWPHPNPPGSTVVPRPPRREACRQHPSPQTTETAMSQPLAYPAPPAPAPQPPRGSSAGKIIGIIVAAVGRPRRAGRGGAVPVRQASHRRGQGAGRDRPHHPRRFGPRAHRRPLPHRCAAAGGQRLHVHRAARRPAGDLHRQAERRPGQRAHPEQRRSSSSTRSRRRWPSA